MTSYKDFKAACTALIVAGIVSACAADRGFPPAAKAEDSKITDNVRDAIAQHPDLGPPSQIYVDTRGHVVYLSGVVDNSQVATNAQQVAGQVAGVSRVVSTLSVDK